MRIPPIQDLDEVRETIQEEHFLSSFVLVFNILNIIKMQLISLKNFIGSNTDAKRIFG